MPELEPSSVAPLRVCLLHNYREAEQISMKLYAERLGAHLASQGVAVESMRPSPLLSATVRSFWLGDKIDSYLGRFVHYPQLLASATSPSSRVYHIVDHGQAHLVNVLDPRRTVITCHDLMLLVLASGRLGRRYSSAVAVEVFRGLAPSLRRAAVVVADSGQTRSDLIQFAGVDEDRIQVIHPGLNQTFVPDAAAREEGRLRWGLQGRQVALQVGNAFYKNIEGGLRIVARLRRQGIDVVFLRGGLPLSSAQRRLAEQLGLTEYVIDLGPLPDHDLKTLYNVADVLLYPSLYEGFGWPPLEAMACGVPVVCSRAGSLAEVAGPAALTADAEDEDSLAEHVVSVLTNPAVASGLRTEGLRHAARFSWHDAAVRFIDLYRRVGEAA